MQISSVNK